MQFVAHTDNKPVVLMFRVVVRNKNTKIRVIVSDLQKPNTLYQNRYKTIDSNAVFYVRMPQSPKHARVQIYNESNGDKNGDDSFKLADKQFLPLKSKFKINDIKNKDIRDFMIFAQEFCENASILSAGENGQCSVYVNESVYGKSPKYRINYYDIIRTRKDNKPLNTPARISKITGVIDCAKKRFLEYTVPMRIAILLHEFSHYYINKEMENEEEADFNALLIYLGLGYPRIEAEQVFLKVFYKTPTDGNKERYNKIKGVIDNFEKVGMRLNPKYYYEYE